MIRRAFLVGLSLIVVSCDSTVEVPRQEATVACGLCRFHIEGSRGCYWAIELQGERYPVVGANTPGHDSHGPEGMCVVDRRAVVEGRIKRGQFLASSFELLPAEGIDPGAAPPTHEH
ncbi:MAG TPA: hypothetical protein ENK18_09165 [Deltaproteobacteria bacterium]|nr:hypothetical protein [Deltaproteobacteria bacterium]